MSGFNGAKMEDRVRVSLTVEGKVIGLGQNSIGVLLDDFDSRNREVIWFSTSAQVEVLASPAKEGDLVSTLAGVEGLPDRTIAKDASGIPLHKLGTRWYRAGYTNTFPSSALLLPLKVLELPED
jgi:hypothetical protein